MTVPEAIAILNSRACPCGAPKARKTAFCGTCYGKLDGAMQRALWSRIGKGFEDAYGAAVAWLRDEGRIG